MESTTRVVLPVVLEHMNAAIEISVEFAEKEVADKRLMAAK
jgi:diacylglycerol kinase